MRNLFHAYLRSPSRTAQFLRFATVGMKISLIDIGGVYLLPWLFGMSLYGARIVSLSTALLVGYLLNRHFTFAHVRQPGRFYRQLAGHFGVHLLGGELTLLSAPGQGTTVVARIPLPETVHATAANSPR